ncbi:uncharacterized protein LOC125654584 [Ostrea edulis]|uniref:uncharacterized protein LOC125654584 n=1 Tax=Ostrea edulis TaxID=37623 RepID=UPI0024AEFF57|nr:uncharacterized protein LOC125654584 [Ostrea edulis]
MYCRSPGNSVGCVYTYDLYCRTPGNSVGCVCTSDLYCRTPGNSVGCVCTSDLYYRTPGNSVGCVCTSDLFYGGKMTTVIADQLNQAIADGSVKCAFVGVTLGVPFIHPAKTVQSWVNYTLVNAIIDEDEANTLTDLYKLIEIAIANLEWKSAFNFQALMGQGCATSLIGSICIIVFGGTRNVKQMFSSRTCMIRQKMFYGL